MCTVQDKIRAKYQVTLDQLRPARSRLPAKAEEDLRVQKCVRYQGQEPTLQDVAKVQKRRQQAQLHSKEGKLHAKGWSQNRARGEGTTAGKQGNNKPKKAAPQATKGKNAATRATGSVLVFKLTQKKYHRPLGDETSSIIETIGTGL